MEIAYARELNGGGEGASERGRAWTATAKWVRAVE